MIVNVVVMGQCYVGNHLLEDFWGFYSVPGTFDWYCRNEDWNSIISKAFC